MYDGLAVGMGRMFFFLCKKIMNLPCLLSGFQEYFGSLYVFLLWLLAFIGFHRADGGRAVGKGRMLFSV